MGGVPDGGDSKESICSSGDLGSIPGSGRSPKEENGYPLHYSCLKNSMDRGAWWATYSPWSCKEMTLTHTPAGHHIIYVSTHSFLCFFYGFQSKFNIPVGFLNTSCHHLEFSIYLQNFFFFDLDCQGSPQVFFFFPF